MKHRHHPEDEGTGGAGAVGLCVTILASLMAFSVGEAGLFEGPPKARMVFIGSLRQLDPPSSPKPLNLMGVSKSPSKGNQRPVPQLPKDEPAEDKSMDNSVSQAKWLLIPLFALCAAVAAIGIGLS